MNHSHALVVYISFLSVASLSAQEAIPVLKMYDVHDLVARQPAKLAPVGPKEATSPKKVKNVKKVPVVGLRSRKTETGDIGIAGMSKFLTTFIEPKLTKHESIEGRKGMLLVRATRDKHTWLRNAIAMNRERAGSTITLKSRFLRVNAGVYQNHVLPLLRDQKHAILSGAQRKELVRAVTAIKGVSTVSAPRLTARPMTISRLTLAKQTTYIKDYDVEIQAAKAVATPIVGIVRDGISLDCTVGLLTNDAVAVNLSLVAVELMQPIPTHKTRIGLGGTLTIQLPQTTTVRKRSAFKLAAGEAALIALPTANKNYLVAIIEAFVKPPRKR